MEIQKYKKKTYLQQKEPLQKKEKPIQHKKLKLLKVQKPINIYNPPYDSSWFETENKLSLSNYINQLYSISEKYLKHNVNPDTIKGIFVPHDGIRYSGLCSASAYSHLNGKKYPIKRIILLCTNHNSGNESSLCFISTTYTNITSYHNNNQQSLNIDTKSLQKLKPHLHFNNKLFQEEHSFYNQLPFIESITPRASKLMILPFLISNNINLLDKSIANNIRVVITYLIELLKKKDTIIICTSDLSHINGQFQYKISSNIFNNIKKQDNEIIQFLYNGLNGVNKRNQKIDDILFIQNAPSCGTLAIYFFAKILNNVYSKINCDSSSGICEEISKSSSSSSDEKSPIINKKFNLSAITNYKFKYTTSSKLHPKLTCYYTSLMRDKIDIMSFKPTQLDTVLEIKDMTQSSVSYAGIIFTYQT
jgi:AmmeMemoRadiSam system protein B